MPNHLIIDGYNLLGVSGGMGPMGSQDGEAVRESLLQDLNRYHQRMGHRVTVVFDAWRQVGGVQRQEHRAGVTVIYSRQGEQADQVIQKMVRDAKGECVVVSSDHEVMNTARAHGAMVITSQEFWPKIKRPTPPSISRSRGKSQDEEIESMRSPSKKKGNPHKLPKAKRKRIRNLGKF
ncbi:MAG: NYN domain-containing protein [Nitrospirota bacterium]|nr:MAG: NYN domain-containing protein [Nitrospirota bacterium]